MSTITQWTVRALALLVIAWLASVAGQWSTQVVNGTSSERLAQLRPLHEPIVVSAAKAAPDTQVR